MTLHVLFSNILLLWSGMILGISFLEAWVKFKAPSLTRAVGLDVGRTVFSAFHKAQWALLGILFLIIFFSSTNEFYLFFLLGLTIILSVQTFWLFPYLCKNVALILMNKSPNQGSYHFLYAVFELLKLAILMMGSFYLII